MFSIRAALVFILIFVSMLLAALASPAQPQVEEWELVAKLCGRLQHIERIPDKKKPIEFSEKKSPIANAKLIAYQAPPNAVCCSKFLAAGETTTNKNGAFEFKELAKGYYWLVARVDERDYRMSVRIGQLKDRQPVCSEMSFEIDAAGEFTLHFRAPGR